MRGHAGPLKLLLTATESGQQGQPAAGKLLANEAYVDFGSGENRFSAGKKILSGDVGYGFRPIDVLQREVRLLALGDSFTEGTGAAAEDAFPARLAARLSQAGAKVRVRNLGRNGYTAKDLIAYELPALAEFRPTLRKGGFLTRDPREKERKKYGHKRARKGFQYSKR